jgi:hypothetical protein
VLGKSLDQQEVVFFERAGDAGHHLAVVDRLPDPVATRPASFRDPDFEIELNGLRHLALPVVYADQDVEPQIGYENGVHRDGGRGQATYLVVQRLACAFGTMAVIVS